MSGLDPSDPGSRSEWTDRPNVVPWPPLIFGGAIVWGVALSVVLPIKGMMPNGALAKILGVALIVIGLGLDIAAMLTMRRHKANILPHRPATALVTGGPFSVSRNPIYLGNTILLIGAALATGNAWLLMSTAVAAALVSVLAIRREERHLAARFGDAWRNYARRTPRWLRL